MIECVERQHENLKGKLVVSEAEDKSSQKAFYSQTCTQVILDWRAGEATMEKRDRWRDGGEVGEVNMSAARREYSEQGGDSGARRAE